MNFEISYFIPPSDTLSADIFFTIPLRLDLHNGSVGWVLLRSL